MAMSNDFRPRRTDPRSTKELIRAALREEDGDRYWEIVDILRYRGTKEEFDAALSLVGSRNAERRELGAEILGLLGGEEKPFLRESVTVLYRLVEHDKAPGVLEAAAMAIGHLHPEDDRVISILSVLKAHPDPAVRTAVAVALGGYDDELVTKMLIDLSSDEDTEARDYATLGLSQLTEADTPEIREALWRRTSDSDPHVRGESLVGLALRKDERVLDLILRELQTRSPARSYAVEAAQSLGNPMFCKALIALRGDEDMSAEVIENAITVCNCTDSQYKSG